MLYREAAPSAELSAVVERFWEIEAPAALVPTAERVLPDGRVELIVHLGDRFARRCGALESIQERVLVAAASDAPLDLMPTGRAHVFAARLVPGAAGLVLDTPLAPLLGATPGLESFWSGASRLADLLHDADGFEGRIERFERHIAQRVRRAPRARRAAAELARASAARLADVDAPRVDDVATEMGCSRRQLERVFAEHVGLEARTLLAIERFQRVFKALSAQPRSSLARVAAFAGYADQSHLVRDFHRFAGRTPSQFLREQHAMSDCFTGLRT